MDTTNSEIDLDEILVALCDNQRRKLLSSLITDSPPNDAMNPGIQVENSIIMHHTHLPKLADCGVIDWNRKRNRVTKGPNFEVAEEVLKFLANNEEMVQRIEVEV
ncbi:hypothetical protein [Halorubrum aidingense]|uniref:hypothetical protein n=1 Tax=Halorubrum aidingense TaxID=368623 RepID=UPI00126748B6|nr:hypothetical protein [Halorubrum aidingense]